MTTKEKAEQLCREANHGLKNTMCSAQDYFSQHYCPNCGCKHGGELALQHWLKLLEEKATAISNLHVLKNGELAIEINTGVDVVFDLTTGQPATEKDYKAILNILNHEQEK